MNTNFYVAMDAALPVMLLAVSVLGGMASFIITTPIFVDYQVAKYLDKPKTYASRDEAKAASNKMILRTKVVRVFLCAFYGLAGIGMTISTVALLWGFAATFLEYLVLACFLICLGILLLAIMFSFSNILSRASDQGFQVIHPTSHVSMPGGRDESVDPMAQS